MIFSFDHASLARRILAFFVDLMILLIPFVLANCIIPIVGGVVILFLYAPILEASEIRATLGKYLVGIQVCDSSGSRISLRAAVVRNVLKFLSVISIFLIIIDFFFTIFTQKTQSLHDLCADSVVVYGRTDRPIAHHWMLTLKSIFPSKWSFSEKNSVLSDLERLQNLRDKGTLTEEEFQEQKKKILT